MRSLPFQSVDGKSEVVIPEMVNGTFSDGDQLYIATNSADGEVGYTIYTYTTAFGWTYGGYDYASKYPVPAGSSFWILAQAPIEAFTITGKVPTEDFVYEAKPGIQMVSCSLPVAISLAHDASGVTWEGFATGDLLQIHTGMGYQTYEWYGPAKAWTYNGNYADDVSIAAGTSFWLTVKNVGASVKVSNPLNK